MLSSNKVIERFYIADDFYNFLMNFMISSPVRRQEHKVGV